MYGGGGVYMVCGGGGSPGILCNCVNAGAKTDRMQK